MGRYTWFKIYAEKWLRGKLRQEDPIVRSVFLDILCMAADSPYCPEIKASDRVGYTDEQFCDMLQLKPEEWILGKQRLKIRGSIAVTENNTIIVRRWKKYQSAYERQKPYQQKYHGKLKELGHKSVHAYFSDVVKDLTRKSSEDKIFEALKNLPDTWHDSLHGALNKIYPGGHSYIRAKRRYDEYREIHGRG